MESVRVSRILSVSLLAFGLAGCTHTTLGKAPVAAPATAPAMKGGKVLTAEQIRERDEYIKRALAKKKHHVVTVASAHPAASAHAHSKSGSGGGSAVDEEAREAKRRKAQDEAELRAMEASQPKGEVTTGHFTAPGLPEAPPAPEPAAPAYAARGGAPAASANQAAAAESGADDSASETEEPGNPNGSGRQRQGNRNRRPRTNTRRVVRRSRPVTRLPRTVTFGPTRSNPLFRGR